MALSLKQLQAVGISADPLARVSLWDGSVRSGKTFSSILRLLAAIATAGPYGEIVVVGKNRDSVYRNVFAPIDSLPDFEWVAGQVKYRQGASTAKIMGRRVNVIGANDAKAENRIRGMTVQVAYIDEVTVIPEDFFKQMLARMSAPGAQMFGTTNPDAPRHWLKAKYLDRLADLPDWRHFKFTLDDNPVLTQAYKDSLKREYTGLWYKRFIEGKWVAAEGAIYDIFDEADHVVPWDDLPPMQRLLGVGIDYGTTNPTSAVMIGLAEDGRLYLIDEFRHDPSKTNRRLTDVQLSSLLREWLDGDHLPYESDLRPEWIFIDPSAASFKVQLANDGIGNATEADNQVIYGIRTFASLLSSGAMRISTRCTGVIDEAPAYAWDTKYTEKGEDKPVKVDDHSLDAARYAVTTTETLWRPWVDAYLNREEPDDAASEQEVLATR